MKNTSVFTWLRNSRNKTRKSAEKAGKGGRKRKYLQKQIDDKKAKEKD